jgi:hypothetical protein
VISPFGPPANIKVSENGIPTGDEVSAKLVNVLHEMLVLLKGTAHEWVETAITATPTTKAVHNFDIAFIFDRLLS